MRLSLPIQRLLFLIGFIILTILTMVSANAYWKGHLEGSEVQKIAMRISTLFIFIVFALLARWAYRLIGLDRRDEPRIYRRADIQAEVDRRKMKKKS